MPRSRVRTQESGTKDKAKKSIHKPIDKGPSYKLQLKIKSPNKMK